MSKPLSRIIYPDDVDFELAWPWMDALLDSLRPHLCLPPGTHLPPAEEIPIVFVVQAWFQAHQRMNSRPLA